MNNSDNGFIVLHRKLLEWEWFADPKTLVVWIYLLFRANWKPNRWKGIEIGRGETLETIAGISRATGLSVQSVRTALEHLKSTNEITTRPTGYGTLISIATYSKYQDLPDGINKGINKEINKRSTNDQQTINNTRTIITKKQEKQEREGTAPALDEINQFVKENGLNLDPQYFFDYYTEAGFPRSWKATARRWSKENNDAERNKRNPAVIPMPSYMQKQKEEMLASDELRDKIRKMQEEMQK
jgi:hypothetical protein